MTDEEFDALWTSCEWRAEIDRLRLGLRLAIAAHKTGGMTESEISALEQMVPNVKYTP
jgi:hypothetical protein